jgi:hypothetical protein
LGFRIIESAGEPHFLFPNRNRLAPWDEVSARRDLKSRSLAAGVEITFEQLQQCRDRPRDDQALSAAVLPAQGGSDIDYEGIAETLLRQGQRLSWRLVLFMRDRTAASFEDVEDRVFGGEREDSSIRSLVNRTNNALYGLEPRLSFTAPDRRVLNHDKTAMAPADTEDAHATPMQRNVMPMQREGIGGFTSFHRAGLSGNAGATEGRYIFSSTDSRGRRPIGPSGVTTG